MTAPIVLIVFALLLALLGPVVLQRISWPERSPWVGIFAWQALSVSLVLTVLLAGVALAVPAIPWTTNLAEIIRACAMALRGQYSTPGGAVVSATGAVAALTVLGRVTYCIVRELVSASRNRKQQLHALNMVAQPHQRYNALIVQHDAAVAYCLPGRGHQIVLTTATLTALDDAQISAVLAHERAHLRGHHHLILAGASALRRAFPGVAAFRHAHLALMRLVEMLADDAAAQQGDRLTVATALVRLGEHRIMPVVALGAGGESTLSRVRRLVSPARPLGIRRTFLAALATAALLALPLFLAAAPASVAGTMPPCAADTSSAAM